MLRKLLVLTLLAVSIVVNAQNINTQIMAVGSINSRYNYGVQYLALNGHILKMVSCVDTKNPSNAFISSTYTYRISSVGSGKTAVCYGTTRWHGKSASFNYTLVDDDSNTDKVTLTIKYGSRVVFTFSGVPDQGKFGVSISTTQFGVK